MKEDTIAAVSTPLGESGIGIVRISGEEALDIAGRVFKPKKPAGWLKDNYKIHYGHIVDQGDGVIIDEVLVSVMKAPFTYTCENVVEINCHGGTTAVREVLRSVLRAGARLAEPGEFTRRAFLNGRIDLAQAESVIDIIRAKTGSSLKVAVTQLKGGLSARISELQDSLLTMLAWLEAQVDFPEDDIDRLDAGHLKEMLKEAVEQVDSLIKTAGSGKVYREGISTVISGRPNVGKSSLLNVLLGENRAIVTSIPGTTRDIIEETLNIRGIPLKLVDTAGLREPQDIVEKIGVEKTRETLKGAGLVLYVIEAAAGLKDDDRITLSTLDRRNTILVINKTDIQDIRDNPAKAGFPFVKVSALTGKGIEDLEALIEEIVMGKRAGQPEAILISNARHEQALGRVRGLLAEFEKGLLENVPMDLLSIDLRHALEALGEITGALVSEDLLDRIFNDFCIGK